MARRALIFVRKPGMKSAAAGDFGGNFLVTILTFQFGGALSDHMATGTLRWAAERLVRARKWTGRYLRTSSVWQGANAHHQQKNRQN